MIQCPYMQSPIIFPLAQSMLRFSAARASLAPPESVISYRTTNRIGKQMWPLRARDLRDRRRTGTVLASLPRGTGIDTIILLIYSFKNPEEELMISIPNGRNDATTDDLERKRGASNADETNPRRPIPALAYRADTDRDSWRTSSVRWRAGRVVWLAHSGRLSVHFRGGRPGRRCSTRHPKRGCDCGSCRC